jgi:hypothetical protein
VGKRGDELPEELRRAETRLERIRQAKRELEEEARPAGQAKKKPADDEQGGSDSGCDPAGGSALPSHQVPTTSEGKPTAKAQRNFTDPDSRVMVGNDQGFIQGYNAQIVVDDAHQVIVAQAVTNQPPDNEHAIPLLIQTRDNCGRAPDKPSLDAGYYSADNVFGLAGRLVGHHRQSNGGRRLEHIRPVAGGLGPIRRQTPLGPAVQSPSPAGGARRCALR